ATAEAKLSAARFLLRQSQHPLTRSNGLVCQSSKHTCTERIARTNCINHLNRKGGDLDNILKNHSEPVLGTKNTTQREGRRCAPVAEEYRIPTPAMWDPTATGSCFALLLVLLLEALEDDVPPIGLL